MKKQTKILLSLSVVLLVLIIAALCLAYFVFQEPLFDRSGWYVTAGGQTQYRDYYAKPLTGWQTIEGKTYYFDTEGSRVSGWYSIEGQKYYFDQAGNPGNGWLDLDGQRYFLTEEGVAYTGWLQQGQQRCYLNGEGQLQTGWFALAEGSYLTDDDGFIRTGWTVEDGYRYYLGEDGVLVPNWVDTELGLTYVKDGQRHIGWLNNEQGKFYFNEEGYAQTGWITDKAGRYYLYEDGTFATGFVEINGIERYFLPTGEYVVLCNPWNPVPEDYEENLVKVGNRKIDAYCYDALMEMTADAKKAGYTLTLNSAYRSFATQTRLFTERVAAKVESGMSKKDAEKLVATSTAVPGTSEHQTGLAVDIMSNRVYKWLASNSWKYGFIVRYPDDKTEITGIIYEPWHLRYVGKEMAKDIYESGLCLEEYLEMLKQQ